MAELKPRSNAPGTVVTDSAAPTRSQDLPATMISTSARRPPRSSVEQTVPSQQQTAPTAVADVHDRSTTPPVAAGRSPEADEQLTPEHQGRYEYARALGSGGIGHVQVVKDRHLGREVALKDLRSRFTSRGSNSAGRTPAETRFLAEARVTGQLEHPGIIPVYELGRRADGSIYYTMKVVRGRTLGDALRGQDLAGRLGLLPHFLDICHALAYAHSRQVIHRDLKPDNVMLGDFGETMVLDWGLAKSLDQPTGPAVAPSEEDRQQLCGASDSATVAGSPMGTPAYMPPEQACGDLGSIDQRSDVYSLGAILYQLLCGRPPHHGTSALEVINKVRGVPVRPPTEREPRCPSELADIAMRALSRDPAQRYPDAGALAADVHAFQTGGLVKAHSYSIAALLARWVRRHRKALAAVAVVLLAGGAAWWYRGHAERTRRLQAEQQRQEKVLAEVDRMLARAAGGKVGRRWFDTYTFKLISLREPLVEDRLVAVLGHQKPAIRRLAARCLGGMRSTRALDALIGRLAPNVEPSADVVTELINALGVIGHWRAEESVAAARRRHGQHSPVWRGTSLAYRMIPLRPLAPGEQPSAWQWHLRGRALENKGHKEAALKAYQQAIDRDPRAWRSLTNRGTVYRGLGHFKEAMADYDRAILLAPGELAALHNRALLKREMGDREGALADLNAVVASGKVGALALRNRAMLRMAMADREGALADIQQALRDDPDNAGNHYYLGKLWAAEESWGRALASFDRALALNPRSVGGYIWRAYLHQIKNNLHGAQRDLNQALLLKPSSLSARRQRANVRLLLGDPAGAREDLDQNIKARPTEAYRWAMRGAVYHAQRGDFAAALADFSQALKRSSRSHRMLLSVCALALAVRIEDAALGKKLRGQILSIKESRKWYAAMGRVATEQAEPASLPALAGKDQVRRCQIHLLTGLRAALAGKHDQARVEYARAGNVPRPNDLPCVLSLALGR